jgi:transposase InsO family protein
MDFVHDQLATGRKLRVLRILDLWAYQRDVTLDFSRPGKPTDNAFIESGGGSCAGPGTRGGTNGNRP